jgi:hypothetical protein
MRREEDFKPRAQRVIGPARAFEERRAIRLGLSEDVGK